MSSIEGELEAATPARNAAAPDGPAGIGGWLLLVAVGQLLAVFGLPVSLAYQYFDPENQKLFGDFPLAMYGELVLNVAIIVLVLVTTLLFFRKSPSFPGVFILECIAGAVLPAVGLVWAAFAFSTQLGRPIGEFLEVEPREVYQFALGVVSAVIWTAYALRSKRVRNTFILGLSARDVRGARAPSTPLLSTIVGIIGVLGLFAVLASVRTMVERGGFNGEFVGGLANIALAVWLFRGSDIARIILGVLCGFGLVASVWIAFSSGQNPYGATAMLILALLCSAVLWVLFFSKRFAAELEINAAKYHKPDDVGSS